MSDLIESITLENMRHNGVRSLLISCLNCRHEKVMNVDHLPGDLTVPSLGRRMACIRCGTVGADAQPKLDRAATTMSRRDRA